MIIKEYSGIIMKVLEYFFCGKFEHQSKSKETKSKSVDGVYDLDVSFLANKSGVECTLGPFWAEVFSIRQFVRVFSGSEQTMTAFQDQASNRPVVFVSTGGAGAYAVRWRSGKMCLEPLVCSAGEVHRLTVTLKVRCSEEEAEGVSLVVRGFLQRAALLHPDASISLNHSRVNHRHAGMEPESDAVSESRVSDLHLHLAGAQQPLITTDLTITTCEIPCPSEGSLGHLHVSVLGTTGCPLAAVGPDLARRVFVPLARLEPGPTGCAAPSPLPPPDACYQAGEPGTSCVVLLVFAASPHDESLWACHRRLGAHLHALLAANRHAISNAVQQQLGRIPSQLPTCWMKPFTEEPCCQQVSTAAYRVLRSSTNSRFRERCFRLMGVNNVHDAGKKLEKCLMECLTPVNAASGDSQATETTCGSQSASQGEEPTQPTSFDATVQGNEDCNEFENMWIQRVI
ncbi:uncharacterized protein LOC134535082 isoform X2 [Bacillus rossius redtenbacheri]|uniref:uncharacterized protein LOC134535082 isoform X2 n=1 Tax=Bacillus rossius redtenbacheri TaxID=93214 RepID=UPI002FDE8BBD